MKLFESGTVFPSMSEEEKREIRRRQGFLTIREIDRAGNTVHFIRIFRNSENKARIFYKFDGSVEFIKNISIR